MAAHSSRTAKSAQNPPPPAVLDGYDHYAFFSRDGWRHDLSEDERNAIRDFERLAVADQLAICALAVRSPQVKPSSNPAAVLQALCEQYNAATRGLPKPFEPVSLLRALLNVASGPKAQWPLVQVAGWMQEHLSGFDTRQALLRRAAALVLGELSWREEKRQLLANIATLQQRGRDNTRTASATKRKLEEVEGKFNEMNARIAKIFLAQQQQQGQSNRLSGSLNGVAGGAQ